MNKRLLLSISCLFVSTCEAARILAIFTIASKSHMSINSRLTDGLIEHHHVTVLSPFPDKFQSPNYTHIDISEGVYQCIDNSEVDSITDTVTIRDVVNFGYPVVEQNYLGVLSNPEVQKIIHSNDTKFDLLLVEITVEACYLEFANKFKIPAVWLAAPTRVFAADFFAGVSRNPSYIPSMISEYVGELTFWERLWNTWDDVQYYYFYYYVFHPLNRKVCQKFFSDTVDYSVDRFHNNVALYLDYGHNILLPRPLVPNYIETGGMHIKEIKPLPEPILSFIENAKNGVIYFSFGSVIQASSMSKDKFRLLVNAFSRIPQRVIWRCDRTDVPELPKTVMVDKWLPQLDILAHSNVRAFISHGGLLSTYEAIHTGTPVIGIPFWIDQRQNINKLASLGAAVKLNFNTLTEETLLSAIDEIMYNNTYTENMKKLSHIFNDRPKSALDTAIYWIEYVIKYKGAHHLRSKSADMPMYQYFLLDVISFVLAVFILIAFSVYWIVRKIVKCVILRRNRTIERIKED